MELVMYYLWKRAVRISGKPCDNYRTYNYHRVSPQFSQPFSIDSADFPCRDPAIPSPYSFHGVKFCSVYNYTQYCFWKDSTSCFTIEEKKIIHGSPPGWSAEKYHRLWKEHIHNHELQVCLGYPEKQMLSRNHGLRTPDEGIKQWNLKFWADVADKICSGRTYKFGIGIWFWPCSEGDFLTGRP